MHERRNHPRLQKAAVVTVIVRSAPEATDLEGRIFPCRLQDVSLGGVKLWVDIPVPVGVLVELEIVFGHSSEIYQHAGTVVWVWGGEGLTEWHNIGIRFNTLSSLQFSSWESVLSELFRKCYTD